MIDGCAKCVVTLALTAVVVVLSGCGKKKQEPPAPAPAQTSEAAKDAQAQADEAAGQTQAMPGMDLKQLLTSVDKNSDGKISREEYGAIWKDKSVAERNFKMFDRNGDGVLSGEELTPKLGTK